MVRLVSVLIFAFCVHWHTVHAERIDWSRGTLELSVSAHGSRRAPSPRLARVSSEARANSKARKKFGELIRRVPLGENRSWKRLTPEQISRLEEIIDAPLVDHVGLHSDGSITLNLAIPLEKLRTIWDGNNAPKQTFNDQGIWVDARQLTVKPTLGVALKSGSILWKATTFWHKKKTSKTSKIVSAKASKNKKNMVLLSDSLEASFSEWKDENRVVHILY